MARKQRIVWIDVESTGIDANTEALLQVACRITDQDLEFIDGDGFEAKIFYTPHEIAYMKRKSVPYVVDMHTKTELWDSLDDPANGSVEDVENALLEHIRKYVPEAGTARLAGNSITLDRNFINVNLPRVGEHLHYRSYDNSSTAGLVEMYMGSDKMYVKKQSSHEAMDDITQSVMEARYYKNLLFPKYKGLPE